MANLTAVVRRQGTNSASYVLQESVAGGADQVLNAALVGDLRAGRLKDFLSTEYADTDAVFGAWADLGGAFDCTNAAYYGWGVETTPGLPKLLIDTTAGVPLILRLSLSYSASE